jgi:hypothetical protein
MTWQFSFSRSAGVPLRRELGIPVASLGVPWPKTLPDGSSHAHKRGKPWVRQSLAQHWRPALAPCQVRTGACVGGEGQDHVRKTSGGGAGMDRGGKGGDGRAQGSGDA